MTKKKKKKKPAPWKPRFSKIAGFFFLILGMAIIFASAALNTLQNREFHPGTEMANQIYMFDLISTLGVVIIPLGLSLLYKKEEEQKLPLPNNYCTMSGIDEASYSYMRWN
jgi:hypothetical protein